ncbi:MAG: YceD family protein [Pseudomonadota bacterium]
MTADLAITAQSDATLPTGSLLRASVAVSLVPDAAWLADLRDTMAVDGLRKVRMQVQIAPEDDGLVLSGHLGATVVQPCIVTLDPVTTRIDTEITRRYRPDLPQPTSDDVEIPEDDSPEPLEPSLNLADLLAEALNLALPLYPRASDAELGRAVFAADGVAPLTDDEVKPFAGLSVLRDKLSKDE